MRADGLLLALLVAADLAFIAVHVVHASTGYLSNPLNALDRDRGYAEFFQYTKLYWLVLLTGLLAFRHRVLVHVGWGVLFAYLLVDDAFTLHEAGGAYAAAALRLGPALGLRAQDLGELIVTAIAGTTALALLAVGYWRADDGARAFSRSLFGLLALLVFFGVGVDMVHEELRQTFAGPALVVVEDGGEMLVVSLMVWRFIRHLTARRSVETIRITSLDSRSAPSLALPRVADHAPSAASAHPGPASRS